MQSVRKQAHSPKAATRHHPLQRSEVAATSRLFDHMRSERHTAAVCPTQEIGIASRRLCCHLRTHWTATPMRPLDNVHLTALRQSHHVGHGAAGLRPR
jgi:hypothetical protein